MSTAREWAPDQRYLADEEMTHAGVLYRCTLGGRTGTWPPLVIGEDVLNGSARFVPVECD